MPRRTEVLYGVIGWSSCVTATSANTHLFQMLILEHNTSRTLHGNAAKSLRNDARA